MKTLAQAIRSYRDDAALFLALSEDNESRRASGLPTYDPTPDYFSRRHREHREFQRLDRLARQQELTDRIRCKAESTRDDDFSAV